MLPKNTVWSSQELKEYKILKTISIAILTHMIFQDILTRLLKESIIISFYVAKVNKSLSISFNY